MPPRLLQLTTIQELLEWYRINLCNVRLTDPRGYRVRFLQEGFIHLIQLINKYGEEPRNAGRALQEIRRGRIRLVPGRFDAQRAVELSWASEIATHPDFICTNWQELGRGDEAYVKSLGTQQHPKYRVLVCEVIGTIRQAVTIFPRTTIGRVMLRCKIWP